MSASGPEAEIEAVGEELALFPDWEERYSYILELGRALPDLAPDELSDANKVRGCASQVWLVSERRAEAPGLLFFRGTSDAHLVRGLIAVLIRIFSGQSPQDILAIDPKAMANRLGLSDALTQQRSNGLAAMMARMRREAETALQE